MLRTKPGIGPSQKERNGGKGLFQCTNHGTDSGIPIGHRPGDQDKVRRLHVGEPPPERLLSQTEAPVAAWNVGQGAGFPEGLPSDLPAAECSGCGSGLVKAIDQLHAISARPQPPHQAQQADGLGPEVEPGEIEYRGIDAQDPASREGPEKRGMIAARSQEFQRFRPHKPRPAVRASV